MPILFESGFIYLFIFLNDSHLDKEIMIEKTKKDQVYISQETSSWKNMESYTDINNIGLNTTIKNIEN